MKTKKYLYKFFLFSLLLTFSSIFSQKKQYIILDKPEIVSYENVSIKFEKYYDMVLVSLNAVKPNTSVIYRGVVSSTKGSWFLNSYFSSSEGWHKIESVDKSSGYLDYNNQGVMEFTLSDIVDVYKIYIFSSELPDKDIGIFVQVNKE
ncbi:hypothetical protein [Chryseobacterium sp.]|uniref:hypothetical protein n=1 Tax=Chryseobacterium sp. TaxID=1871047 RepID=UPI000EC2608C|nr:hypothetical protein [Chryseobacterium sp.]HCA06800.1 hypothetical protein [Chryseobacterium sp.]